MTVRLLPKQAESPMANLANDYLNHCRARGIAPRTDHQYSYSLHSVFLPWCAKQRIDRVEDFDRRAADRFTATLLNHRKEDGEPLSKYSVATYTRPVRQMLAWAREEGEQVKGQPQLPRRPKPLRDVLSRDKIDRLEKALPTDRDRVLLRVFADCGPRLEEVARLRTTDVVRAGREAYLRVHGKRDRFRDVPIAPELLRRVERLIRQRPQDCADNHIFLAARRAADGAYVALSANAMYQVIKDAAARAKFEKRVYPHLLRHSWMTEMVRCGMHPMQLTLIAGASVEVIMDCYTHLTKADAYDSMMRALASPSRP